MNTKIKVSVVIPVYNAEKLIIRCLDSILNQDCDYEIEIVAVDDGSTDSSLKILREFTGPVKIFKQENLGPAAARNRGIEEATGDYLAFLDADDYWLPKFLITTIQFLENNAEVIAVNVGQIHKIPGKKDVTLPKVLVETNELSAPLILENFFDFWFTHKHICTGSVVIRMHIAKQSGGQLVDFRISQDLEYWSYLGTLGKWAFIPQILFVSDGGQVTKDRGWLSKNLIRWNNTPNINDFEKRTLLNLKDSEKNDFKKVVGWVAFNFTYNHIMAGNYIKARKLILSQFQNFPKHKMSKIYKNIAKSGLVPFSILAFFIKHIQISRQLIMNWK